MVSKIKIKEETLKYIEVHKNFNRLTTLKNGLMSLLPNKNTQARAYHL